MNWYIAVLKKYAVFNGRARRQEYWYFLLFNVLIAVCLSLIDTYIINPLLGIPAGTEEGGLLSSVYSLAVLVPSIAVGVRRLHDIGKSGWWLLISLIPLIGVLVLVYFFVQDSHPEANEYGPNPKDSHASNIAI
ncbi:membrane protein [Photobacterium aquae]|uniref:Membrane protein n=1 Tax=Photobacterium aquae TaxID=1195763 RepID=A0A0J1HB04_9GAMM|nr:DUF805 domain-containing protein [Photobacterium aquae]KLV08835.1 membrane protein [Photobacterium aquae]